MNTPEEFKYTKEHEWIQITGNTALIGITDYAQDQLGEVVFVELPEVGEEFGQGDAFGVVESVKSVSDVFAPFSGKVIECNETLTDTPELINDDAYTEGWMVKMEIENDSELEGLLSAEEYQAYVREEV